MGLLPMVAPEEEDVAAELPKGEEVTPGFCWLVVTEEEAKGEGADANPVVVPNPDE